MSTLRISDAPLLPDVDGTEKIPTGGRGDYTISVDQIKGHIFQDIGKELVGLGNVDNTSDLDKPVSIAQQAALNLKADKTYVDANLDLKADKTNVYTRPETSIALSKKADLVNGVIPENQIPSSFNDVLEFTTTNLPIIGESGKIYVTTDNNKTWRWSGNKYVEISGWNPDSVSKNVTLPTYYTKEAGVDSITGVADGAYFNVRSSSDELYVDEYQNVGGEPTPSGKSYPSSEVVQKIADYTALPFVIGETYRLSERVQLENGDIVKSTIPNNTANPNVDMTGWVLESSKSVSNPSDLATLQNPKNKQRVHVESIQKTFVYDENLTLPENGVTVVGKWEMEIQDAYYASWFADSTSNTSQALKIQGGYDYATSKKRAFIIDAEFWVDANAMDTGIANGNRTAILIRSNAVLHFTGQGKLKALPNNYYIYALITACGGADNFIITYPKLIGEVFQHIGDPTEFGYGLAIYECSNGYIKQPHCSELTGDGIYVGKSAGDPTGAVPKNILIEKPVISQVRRNGISFCAWDNVRIVQPDISYVGDFANVTGAYPKSGIDIEPEMNPDYTPSITCRNGVIKSPYISNCNVGIQTYCGLNAIEVGLHVQGITTLDNITEYATSFSWGSANCVGLIKFDHIHFTHLMPTGRHLQFMFDATGTLLLEIDRVSYDFRDKGFTVIHNPIGIYAANLVGNVHINNFEASGLVFVSQGSGVDNTNKTLSNFKLLKSQGSIGSILDIDVLKNPFPNTSCTIDSKYVFADDLFLANYRGGDTLVCSRDTPSTVTVDSASNGRKLRLEYDNTKTGYTLRLVGINYIRGDGLNYTVATTTMRGAWIEFENVGANNTFIHSMSEGWVFS